MRLINGDALRAKMYHEAFEVDSDLQKWDNGCWIRYKLFEKCMDSMPTIEQGEWLDIDCLEYPCVCSVCGAPQDIKAKFLYSFCPNCGADMRRRAK